MANIFSKISDKTGGIKKSSNWYRNAVASLADTITARKLMNQGRVNQRPSGGRLNLFLYDPKTKNKLPYYDTFPLVLPLEAIKGGFMGINFHYLSPMIRFRLLNQLQKFATNSKFDSTTRLDVSYQRVSGLERVKPTIKKYLYSHVRSGFLRIDAQDSPTAVYLPVQQFRKRSASFVYGQSRGI
mgnify:FL=1|tara:strand:- start:153 stop:704 length:552 start_codon:yes stop_codon:yes gene_type:complete